MAMMTTIEKILARAAELEAQAAALRVAATVLNGDVHTGKRATAASTITQAITLRRAQRNGAPAAEEAAPAAKRQYKKRRSKSQWARTLAQREKKRAAILAILGAYGKPMPLGELTAAARKRGIYSLTGISGSVRSGYLKQTGRRGKTFYSVGADATPA